MNIIIMVNGRPWEDLSEEEKRRCRIQLNDQGMAAAGYVRDKGIEDKNKSEQDRLAKVRRSLEMQEERYAE